MTNGRKYRIAVCQPRIAAKATFAEQYAIELQEFADLDSEFFEAPYQEPEAFATEIEKADAVITSWGVKFDADLLGKMRSCIIISVGSVGVDTIDINAATREGIVVTNVPDIFTEEVADHCMSLLLSCARRLKAIDHLACSNSWPRGRIMMEGLPRLRGQILGLLSFGNVARAVARRALPFGFRIIAHDPYISEQEMIERGIEPVAFDELIEKSDFLSLHTILNVQTRHLVDAGSLARMKTGAVLVNTARGSLIDEQALIEALRSGQLGAAGLDVLEQEPPHPDNPLLQMDNVVLTTHCASSSTRMRSATRRRAAREAVLALTGLWPMSCVNPAVLSKVPLCRWQPHSMQKGLSR